MKSSQLLTLVMLLFCLTACADKRSAEDINPGSIQTKATAADTIEAGEVIERVICKNDTSQSYALYVPRGAHNKTSPVIYFFDPHSDGALPLKKYKALADKYDFILIGSNNSKNGNDWPVTENIWRALFNDSQGRLNVDPGRIYTVGFSGGAKVAGYVALHHSEVKAVIANGAGLPDETTAGDLNFSFTAIAGEGDMNMTGLAAFTTRLDKTQTRHRIIFFDGIHEWAPENTMSIAFTGLQFDAMYEKLILKDDSLISGYIKESKKRFDKHSAANNLVKAEEECKLSIAMLEGLTDDVKWFKEKDILLISTDTYRQQWQIQQNLFIKEEQLKAGYMQHFQQPGKGYWITAISDLEGKARAKNAEGAMYQRLRAYLSLAFYSLSNRFINAGQDTAARYFIDLYKLADPRNSEAWYLSAVMKARNNQVKATEADLLTAVKLGFNDKARILHQPDFQKTATKIDLTGIISKMKRASEEKNIEHNNNRG